MKLEVGKFVRTKAGMIAKIISKYNVSGSLHKDEIVFILDNGNKLALHSRKVIKASNNIIDILEVGDIIKFDITDTDNYAEIQGYNCWEISCEEELNGVKEMILMESAKLISIITREQTESMQYKVD